MYAGRVIRPHDHFSAVAIVNRVCADAGILVHISHGGVVFRAFALEITTYQYGAAAVGAGCVNICAREQANLVA